MKKTLLLPLFALSSATLFADAPAKPVATPDLDTAARELHNLGEAYFQKYNDDRVKTLMDKTRQYAAIEGKKLGLDRGAGGEYAFLLHNHDGYASEVSARIQTGIDAIEVNKRMKKQSEEILAQAAEKTAQAQRDRAAEEKARDQAKEERQKILNEIAQLQTVRLVEAKRADNAKSLAQQLVVRTEAMQKAFDTGALELRLQTKENVKLKQLNESLEDAITDKATRLEAARLLTENNATVRPSRRTGYVTQDGERLGAAATEISDAK